MVSLNPNALEARLSLINFLKEKGRLDDAAKENALAQNLITAAKDDPDNQSKADLLFGSAEIVLAQRNTNDKSLAVKKTEEATKLFTQGMTLFPKDARFFIGKAQLELARGPAGKASALEVLHQAIPLVGDNAYSQWMVAKLLIDAGDKAEAVKLITVLRNKFGGTPVLEYLRARLLYDEGKVGEAVTIQERIKESLTQLPSLAVESDFLLTGAYAQLGNPDRRLAAFERILKVDPSISLAQVGKADSLVALGRSAEALEIYRKQLSKVPTVRLSMIRQLLALELKKPEQQRNFTEISSLLEQSSPEEKKSKDYTLATFQLLASNGKRAELEKAINQACAENPREIAYWMAKLTLANQASGQDDASRRALLQKTIQEAEAAAGDRPELRLAKAILSINLPRDKVVPALESLEAKTEQWSPADQAALKVGLANVYFSIGYNLDAKRLLKQILETNPAHYTALQLLVDISIDEKDDAETIQLIERMRTQEGEEGFHWRMSSLNRLFAKLQAGERNVNVDARKLVDELSKLRPSWNQVATAQGRLLELNGQMDQALEQYKKAIELGERNPEIIKKTVQLLTLRRRPEEAKQILAVVLDNNSTNPAYTRLASEVALKANDDPEKILAKAKQSIRSDSKDFRDFIWLGNIQLAAKDKAGAEASIKQALALGKEEPEAWADWVVFLIQTDRKDEAATELKKAESILKDKSTYVLLAYYRAMDLRDKAEEQYMKIIGSNPNDVAMLQSLVAFHFKNGDFAKAETLLKKKLDESLIDANTQAWARRSYALTLAVKGDYPSFQQALSLIEQNLKESNSSPEDLRTRALILATRPGSRQSIIKDLEVSFASLKPNPGEAILLAQLYEDEGNWKKAATILDDMVRSPQGDSPRLLAYYVQALLRNNEKLDLAEQWMKKLEEKAPKDNLIIEPKARLLFAKGDKKEAVEFLLTNANRIFSESKDPSILFFTATLLEQNKEVQAAENLFKKLVAETSSKTPGSIMALVAFLARQGRIAEAISLCENSWDKIPTGQVAMGMVAALFTGKPLQEDIAKVEKRLSTASKAQPQDVGVAIALADFLARQNRPTSAEEVYRKILQQDNSHPVALNNLAWLLSERPAAADESLQLINRAIGRMGPVGALLDTRGMILLRNGKVIEALKDLDEAVQKDPKSKTHWLHLAYAQRQANNKTDALRSWQKILAMKVEVDQLEPADRVYYSVLKSDFNK